MHFTVASLQCSNIQWNVNITCSSIFSFYKKFQTNKEHFTSLSAKMIVELLWSSCWQSVLGFISPFHQYSSASAACQSSVQNNWVRSYYALIAYFMTPVSQHPRVNAMWTFMWTIFARFIMLPALRICDWPKLWYGICSSCAVNAICSKIL